MRCQVEDLWNPDFDPATGSGQNPAQVGQSELSRGGFVAGTSDDGTGALQPDSLLGVTVAGKYVVKRILGAGGMGAVYLARQRMLNREVALKVLRPPSGSGVDRELFDEMFLAEAAAVAQLKSPHAVTVYDFGRTDKGTLFIAMDYLEGRSLAAVLEEDGVMDAGAAVHVGVQVCRALREAHEHDIVHRDLKPANVMLSDRNNDPYFATVLDFGLAGELPMEEGDDSEGARFLGSPRFAAPEQFIGDGSVDRRSDVYGFGLLLYTMLSGRPPFDGDTGQLALAHVTRPPPTLAEVAPGVPAQLSTLVHRCLAKDPADRFDDMTEVIRALGEVDLPNESHEPEITPHDLADFAAEIGLDEIEPVGAESDELSIEPVDLEADTDELGAITDETPVDDLDEITEDTVGSADPDERGSITDESRDEPSESSVSPPPPWKEAEQPPANRRKGGGLLLIIAAVVVIGGVAIVGAWVGMQFLPGRGGDRSEPVKTEDPTEAPTDVSDQEAPTEAPVEVEIEDETQTVVPEPPTAAEERPTPTPPEPVTETSDREAPTAAEEITEAPTPYDEPPTAAPADASDREPPTEEVQPVDGYKDDPY